MILGILSSTAMLEAFSSRWLGRSQPRVDEKKESERKKKEQEDCGSEQVRDFLLFEISRESARIVDSLGMHIYEETILGFFFAMV